MINFCIIVIVNRRQQREGKKRNQIIQTNKQNVCVCAYAVNEMKKKPEDLNAIRITAPRVLHTVENVSEVKKMRERHTQQEEKK